MLNAQNNIAADPADNWVGYMNVFDMSNAYQFGSGWGLSDLKTTLDVTANTITLQPNFNTYADNPGDAYWQNGAIGNLSGSGRGIEFGQRAFRPSGRQQFHHGLPCNHDQIQLQWEF